MIKIKIIALGKLKEKYLKDAVGEYIKRLSTYAKVEITELEPVKLPENPSEAEIERALSVEAQMIKKKLSPTDFVTSLCIEGRQPSSEELSAEILAKINEGFGSLVYIIGSSHGLADEIKANSHRKLSFSKMTFPHQLFRVMLLEQLYRGFKIAEGSKYHK